MRLTRTDLLLGAVATAGLGVPFLLIAVAQEAMSTQVMAAVRVLLAAGVLLALLARSGRAGLGALRDVLAGHTVAALVVAVTAAVVPNLLIGAAERHVPSGAVAVILATTPLWIAIGGALRPGPERLRARQWIALPIAVLGVGLATGASAPTGDWRWYALALSAAVSYAISNLAVRRHLAGVSPIALTASEMLIASSVLVPVAAAHPGAVRLEPAPWVAVVVAGVGCSALGWMANTALVQRVGAARASVVSYAAVVVSVLLGVAVLGEPFDLRVAAGCAVLVGAVATFLSGKVVNMSMLELCVLGFLAEAPMHAYDLRRRISALTGHVRTVSDGALNPALKRLDGRGLLDKRPEPGEGGPARLVYTLTDAGRAELHRRLSEPAQLEITDRNSFFTILAFLHELPDPAEQRAVLERRLAFIEEPSRGFFVPEDRTAQTSTFRDGMTSMARATWTAERAWLRRIVTSLT